MLMLLSGLIGIDVIMTIIFRFVIGISSLIKPDSCLVELMNLILDNTFQQAIMIFLYFFYFTLKFGNKNNIDNITTLFGI